MQSKNIAICFLVMFAGLALIFGYLLFNGGPSYIPYISAQKSGQPINTIDIVPGSSSPTNGQFFVPPEAPIKQNTNPTWINKDTALHTVTSAANNTGMPSFSSGLIKPGESWSKVTFSKPGVFGYYCSIYPWMVGKIVVKSQ